MKKKAIMIVCGLGGVLGCHGDSAGPELPVPSLDAVVWDQGNRGAIDWPSGEVAAQPSDDASSFAVPGQSTGEGVWHRLSELAPVYLRAWQSLARQSDEPSASDVVDAFNELAYAITGPQGFWRKTVMEEWLGCGRESDTAACAKLAAGTRELAQWDALQAQIGTLDAAQSRAFLQRNQKRLIAYLDMYVPRTPSASAMKETTFYRTKLAGLIDGSFGPERSRDL